MARPGRGRLSGVDLLPPECDAIVAWAAQELQSRERTQQDIYAEFFEKLQALQAEHHGELEFTIPSRSAFNRYSLRRAAMTRRLTETREIAATIASKFDAQASDDVTLIAAEAIKTLVYELLETSGEAGLDPKGAMDLANALRAAVQAQTLSSERKRRLNAEFAAKVDKAVDTVAKQKGMSAETAEAIKAQILGIKADA